MSEELQKKIERSIRLIKQSAPKDGSPIEVAYSGGKDSDVILQLTKESGVNYRAIYKNTTIDPPGTVKHARDMGAEVRMPKNSFFELVEKNGFPSRRRRFCCKVLKEYKVLDKVIIGVRSSESVSRSKRYKEPTQCRVYSKTERVEQILPILDWTDKDVEEFILERGIKCAPVYYDEDGSFHVERRLGCIGCPLASNPKRIEAFKKYPKMLRAYIRAGGVYLKTHPKSKAAKMYKNGYEFIFRNLFCNSQEDFDLSVNGIFGRPDYKTLINKYFGL